MSRFFGSSFSVFAGLALVALAGCASHPVPPETDDGPTFEKPPKVLKTGNDTARYSYATGCLQAYQRICGKLSTEELKAACREDGLAQCEKYAQRFGDWLDSGHPR